MAVEAVEWTGMNHKECIEVFGMETLSFGYEDVFVSGTRACPGDYIVKAGDKVVVFGEKQFKAVFTEE